MTQVFEPTDILSNRKKKTSCKLTSCRGAESFVPSSSSSSDRRTGRSVRRGFDGRLELIGSLTLFASLLLLSVLKSRYESFYSLIKYFITLKIFCKVLHLVHQHQLSYQLNHHHFYPKKRHLIHYHRPKKIKYCFFVSSDFFLHLVV
jgi:hypothetical protein